MQMNVPAVRSVELPKLGQGRCLQSCAAPGEEPGITDMISGHNQMINYGFKNSMQNPRLRLSSSQALARIFGSADGGLELPMPNLSFGAEAVGETGLDHRGGAPASDGSKVPIFDFTQYNPGHFQTA